jgi:hypothetical protein
VIELGGDDVLLGVRANRQFLGRAGRYLVEREGIRQFLDTGTGLPSANNTHEVSQVAAPDSKVVYVDNDPIVLAHARALLITTPHRWNSGSDKPNKEGDMPARCGLARVS